MSKSALSTTGVLALALTLGLGGGVGGAFATTALISADAQETPTGQDGTPGPTGPRGEDGTDGADGQNGTDGADGRPGAPGPRGAAGSSGATGPAGAVGPRGASGAEGIPGPAGAIGPAGATGAQGDPGAPGPVGPQGPAGAQGAQGAQGPVGARGPAGVDAESRYTVLTAQPTFTHGTNTVRFTDVNSGAQPAATVTDGVITLPEGGTYRVNYLVAPEVASTASISIGSTAPASYAVRHNDNEVAGSVVQRPIFDVNIALVLTLRTVIQGGSYSSTSYIAGAPGDTIQFVYESDLTAPERKTNVTLIIEKVD